MYEYDLFSVVCHEGQIDNGHYICFTRHQGEVRAPAPLHLTSESDCAHQWYRYDDDK